MSHEHLDDEALSTLLDGADEAAIAGCGTCAARLDALRSAAALVGADLHTVPADRREVAVAAAMAEAHEIGLVAPADGEVRPARVVELDGRRRQPSRPHPAMGWVAAAAAVVAFFGLVGVITGGDDQPDSAALESFSSDQPETAEAGLDASAAPSSDPAAGAFAYEGGDLGSFDDQQALAGAVLRARDGEPAASAPGGGGAGSGGASQSSGAFVADDDAANAEADGEGPAAASSRARAPEVDACREVLVRDFPSAGGPVLGATATYQGARVVVLVHLLDEPDADGREHGVWVMAADGCDLVDFFAI